MKLKKILSIQKNLYLFSDDSSKLQRKNKRARRCETRHLFPVLIEKRQITLELPLFLESTKYNQYHCG